MAAPIPAGMYAAKPTVSATTPGASETGSAGTGELGPAGQEVVGPANRFRVIDDSEGFRSSDGPDARRATTRATDAPTDRRGAAAGTRRGGADRGPKGRAGRSVDTVRTAHRPAPRCPRRSRAYAVKAISAPPRMNRTAHSSAVIVDHLPRCPVRAQCWCHLNLEPRTRKQHTRFSYSYASGYDVGMSPGESSSLSPASRPVGRVEWGTISREQIVDAALRAIRRGAATSR